MAYTGADFNNNIKAQVLSGSSGFASAALEAPREPAMSRLWSAIDRLRKAEAESADVTAHLCGSAPDEGASKSTLASGSGLFDGIVAAADAINEIASRVSASAARVQRNL